MPRRFIDLTVGSLILTAGDEFTDFSEPID
jgi:hypothetical protein